MVPILQDKSRQLGSEVHFPMRMEAWTGSGDGGEASGGSSLWVPCVLSHFEVLLALSGCVLLE